MNKSYLSPSALAYRNETVRFNWRLYWDKKLSGSSHDEVEAAKLHAITLGKSFREEYLDELESRGMLTVKRSKL